jgi:predicted GNAT superfamily acetyltransferase
LIIVKEIIATDYVQKMSSLFVEHWQENEKHLSDSKPAPMVEAYKSLEQSGYLVAFGAFHDDEMIGYCIAFVLPHLHYGFMYGNHDVLFLKKDYRAGSTGLKLINRVTKKCKELGAKFMLWHSKPGTTMDLLLIKTGAKLEETVYMKEF